MKKIIIIYVTLLIWSYLLISFIKSDLNIMHWSEDNRAGCVFLSNAIFILYLVYEKTIGKHI